MAAIPAFDLDAAVDNARARVAFHIKLEIERHEAQLASRMLAMRAAWRNRHLLMLRDLRGVAFPTTRINLTNLL